MLAGGPAWAASHSVSMVDFSFGPSTLTINVGDSVTWTNDATDPHTSTSDTGLWDSGSVDPGQSFTHTFSSAGTFAYHCTFHQSLGMVGTIVVAASGTLPPGSPLPNTGSSSATGPLVVLGLVFLVAGGLVLYRLRRLRRA